MPGREIKLQPESIMVDVRLGVTVAGLYTLVGMGLIIAFMRRAASANDPDLPLPEFTAAIDDKRYLFSVFYRLRSDPFGG